MNEKRHHLDEGSGDGVPRAALPDLGQRVREEILGALADESSALNGADLYLRLWPFFVGLIEDALEDMAAQGLAVRGDRGAFWRASYERLDSGEGDGRDETGRRVPTKSPDADSDAVGLSEALPITTEPASVPSRSVQRQAVEPRVDDLRLSKIAFESDAEKALFMSLIGFADSEIATELNRFPSDVQRLVERAVRREGWASRAAGIAAVRRGLQGQAGQARPHRSLAAWAASFDHESRRIVRSIVKGESVYEAAMGAGVAERVASRLLDAALMTFPREALVVSEVASPDLPAEASESSPRDDNPQCPAAPVCEKRLGPFKFEDTSDAVTFLYALGASERQICLLFSLDSRAYGDLLKLGNERWAARKRAGRGGLKVDPCTWATSLRRSDARIVVLWLLGRDLKKVCSESSYGPYELSQRLNKILEGAPCREAGVDEGGPAGQEMDSCDKDDFEAQEDGSCFQGHASHAEDAPRAVTTLAQWLSTLDGLTRGALITLFSGERISEYAMRHGASITTVRRSCQSELGRRPALLEDRYRYLYETYKVSSEDFRALTSLGSESYGYLRSVSNKGGGYRPLRPSGLTDEKLPPEVKERLSGGDAGVSSSGYLRIDGKLVRLTFEGLVSHFGSGHAQARPMGVGDLSGAYNAFLEAQGLGGREHLRLPDNPQTAAQRLAATDRFLVPRQSHVRYYRFDDHDFSPLVEIMRVAAERNVECSAKVVFCQHRTLMETLELQDEYELHAIVRRLKAERGLPGVELGTCPILRLGECDRHAQILEVIKDLSPATADEIASAYEERYGVLRSSVKASYLRDFAAYQRNGRYEYRKATLTGEMEDFLKEELTGDYAVLSLVQTRFAVRFPQASRLDVNDAALSPFGYHTSCGLIVRDGMDERATFGRLIDEHEQFAFGDVGFDEAVCKHPAFRCELRARMSSLSYVEWMRGHYVSVERLESAFGMGREELRSYMDYVLALAEPGVPFTVPGLVLAGRRHALDVLT